MRGDSFSDTNIFVYAASISDVGKQARSLEVIEMQKRSSQGSVSYQVLQEFVNTILRTSLAKDDAASLAGIVRTTFAGYRIVWPSFELLNSGLRIQTRYQFHWYDSLIVAAALEAGCETLYTEDLQHGQKIESLTIVNPFLET